jgi:hypothetical protein
LNFVAHRYNFADETPINRKYFDEVLNKAVSKDTANIMTHVTGVDFNSLYPSSYSSIKSNKIPYTNGRLLMPGDFKEYILDKQKMKNIIRMREELFIIKVKRGIPKSIYNKFIEFPLIIGNVTYDQQRKLTQLLTTMGKYMLFNNHYLWFLIDRCGFEIDE